MTYFRILVVVSLFSSVPAMGQSRDSILRVYNNETIYRYGSKFIRGNERLSFHDLGSVFTTPGTLALYHKSKRFLAVSRLFNVTSVALIITSIFTKTNVKGSIGFAAVTGALGLTGTYFQTQSSKYIDRATWETNRTILSGMLQQ